LRAPRSQRLSRPRSQLSGKYYGIGISLPSLPFPNYNGLFIPQRQYNSPQTAPATGNAASFAVSQSIHFINGIVFGLWFAIVVYNKIPTFLPKMKSIQKGLLFAIVQTIISTGFLFPYVYARKLGFGIFSFGDNLLGTNHDHWKLPFAILLWHLIWGAILGYLYDPKKPEDPTICVLTARDSIPGRVCTCRPGPFASPWARS
jgi:hypothetical protein